MSDRMNLKDELLRLPERKLMFPFFGYKSFCMFCGGALITDPAEFAGRIAKRQDGVTFPVYPLALEIANHGIDMHEWLVKRSDAQGWSEEDRQLIFHPLNCVNLHGNCHKLYGQSKTATNLITQKMIYLYGAHKLVNWIKTLPFKNEPTEYLNLIAKWSN
jgi:hypothetical protein